MDLRERKSKSWKHSYVAGNWPSYLQRPTCFQLRSIPSLHLVPRSIPSLHLVHCWMYIWRRVHQVFPHASLVLTKNLSTSLTLILYLVQAKRIWGCREERKRRGNGSCSQTCPSRELVFTAHLQGCTLSVGAQTSLSVLPGTQGEWRSPTGQP